MKNTLIMLSCVLMVGFNFSIGFAAIGVFTCNTATTCTSGNDVQFQIEGDSNSIPITSPAQYFSYTSNIDDTTTIKITKKAPTPGDPDARAVLGTLTITNTSNQNLQTQSCQINIQSLATDQTFTCSSP